MAEILKFEKPSIEEKFYKSLNDTQKYEFDYIMNEIYKDFSNMQDYIDRLEQALVRKNVELAEIKLERGEIG